MGDTCILFKGASFSGCNKTLSVALLTLAVGANGAIFSGEQSAMLGRYIYIYKGVYMVELFSESVTLYSVCTVNTLRLIKSFFKQDYY